MPRDNGGYKIPKKSWSKEDEIRVAGSGVEGHHMPVSSKSERGNISKKTKRSFVLHTKGVEGKKRLEGEKTNW